MIVPKLLLALFSSVAVLLTGCGNSGYREKGLAWAHDGIPFTPLDPKTFKPLDDNFARDAKSGYYMGTSVLNSDGPTFEALSDHEARDRNSVYYCDTYRKAQEYWAFKRLNIFRIPSAEPATYKVLTHGYARDADHVFYEGLPFEVRSVATFEPLNRRFARDEKRAYFEKVEIAGSDGATFAMVSDTDLEYARDKNAAYHARTETTEPNRPKLIVKTLRGASVASLRTLGRGYASDGKHVWYRGEPMNDAEASSFVVEQSSTVSEDAHDRLGAWQGGRRKLAN